MLVSAHLPYTKKNTKDSYDTNQRASYWSQMLRESHFEVLRQLAISQKTSNLLLRNKGFQQDRHVDT